MTDIVALGELLIDFTQQSANEDGYPLLAANPGGAPCNYLAAASALGLSTAFIGKVGNDSFGKMLVKSLKDTGVNTDGVIFDDSVFTTLAFVTLDRTGDRSFDFARKPGADTQLREEEIRLSILDECKIFHFGSLSLTQEPARSATCAAVRYAKSAGKTVSFDPNLRRNLWQSEEEAKQQILWGLAQADIVKMSDEEADFLFRVTPAEGAKLLTEEYGVKLALVTCGASGAHVRCNRTDIFIKAPEVHPKDTTGAGDIFGGSAAGMLLRAGKPFESLTSDDLESIGQYAAYAASLSTEHAGGMHSVPSPHEVFEKMREK